MGHLSAASFWGVQSIFLSVVQDNDYSYHLFDLMTSTNIGIDDDGGGGDDDDDTYFEMR
jgi:hypothetical protein